MVLKTIALALSKDLFVQQHLEKPSQVSGPGKCEALDIRDPGTAPVFLFIRKEPGTEKALDVY